jgi:hypothetical protein
LLQSPTNFAAEIPERSFGHRVLKLPRNYRAAPLGNEMRKQPPKLAAVDIFFLRWLRDNGGKCDLPGDTDLGAYYRVVNSGYVEVGVDRFSDALRFTLTGMGRQAIEANGFQNVVAKPRRGRSRTRS